LVIKKLERFAPFCCRLRENDKTQATNSNVGAAMVRPAFDAQQVALLNPVARGRRAQEMVDRILGVNAARSRLSSSKLEN